MKNSSWIVRIFLLDKLEVRPLTSKARNAAGLQNCWVALQFPLNWSFRLYHQCYTTLFNFLNYFIHFTFMINQYLFKIRKKYFIFTPKFQIFDVSDTLTGPDGGDEGGRKEGRKEGEQRRGKRGKSGPSVWEQNHRYLGRNDALRHPRGQLSDRREEQKVRIFRKMKFGNLWAYFGG